jgi:hypothetical protein
MMDLLLPRTDAGVLLQAAVLALVFSLALWRTWRHPDVRLVAIGLGLVLGALMGLRAAH